MAGGNSHQRAVERGKEARQRRLEQQFVSILDARETKSKKPEKSRAWALAWSWPAVGAVVLALLGGGWTFMTSAHPAIVADCFFGFAFVLLAARIITWEEHKKQSKVIWTAICLMVGVFCMWGNHRLNSKVLLPTMNEPDPETDVWQNLRATATLPNDGDIFKTNFEVMNSGIADIGQHQISCHIFRITNDLHSAITRGLEYSIWPGVTRLRRGGDSQSDQCLSRGARLSGNVTCSDVMVTIEYVLSDRPGIKKRKEFRFVFTPNIGWHRNLEDYGGTYCDGL